MNSRSDGSGLKFLLEEMMKVVWHYKQRELRQEISKKEAAARSADDLKKLVVGFVPEDIIEFVEAAQVEERDKARIYVLGKVHGFMKTVNVLPDDEFNAQIEEGVKKD